MSTQTIPISGTKPAPGSTMTSERLQSADAPVPERFDFDTSAGVRLRVQSPDPDQLDASKPAGATAREISFGPFRLLPAQFLLLEGDKPVLLGSRALHILMVLLERPGELVTRQELMAGFGRTYLSIRPPSLSIFLHCAARCVTDVMGIGSLSISVGAATVLSRQPGSSRKNRALDEV
jgi:hypothetical protein